MILYPRTITCITLFVWSKAVYLSISSGYCNVPAAERVTCGSPSDVTKSKCKLMGCCWDGATEECFYSESGKFN